MSLRLEVAQRNYELEGVVHNVKGKRIQIRENPLAGLIADAGAVEDPDEDPEEVVDNADSAATTISHKLGQHNPLEDFHKLEVMMLNREEFETWDQKKLKIFAQFKDLTDGADIMIDERRDRDTDRVIRYGKGKSRMDQLEFKAPKASSSRSAQTLSAQDFTTQLERLNKEMNKFWGKEDKVACIRIAI